MNLVCTTTASRANRGTCVRLEYSRTSTWDQLPRLNSEAEWGGQTFGTIGFTFHKSRNAAFMLPSGFPEPIRGKEHGVAATAPGRTGLECSLNPIVFSSPLYLFQVTPG